MGNIIEFGQIFEFTTNYCKINKFSIKLKRSLRTLEVSIEFSIYITNNNNNNTAFMFAAALMEKIKNILPIKDPYLFL